MTGGSANELWQLPRWCKKFLQQYQGSCPIQWFLFKIKPDTLRSYKVRNVDFLLFIGLMQYSDQKTNNWLGYWVLIRKICKMNLLPKSTEFCCKLAWFMTLIHALLLLLQVGFKKLSVLWLKRVTVHRWSGDVI